MSSVNSTNFLIFTFFFSHEPPSATETVHLHFSKALFSLDPDNLQLHCFLGLGTLFVLLYHRPTIYDVANGTGRFGEENGQFIYLFCHTEKNTVNSDKMFINSFE